MCPDDVLVPPIAHPPLTDRSRKAPGWEVLGFQPKVESTFAHPQPSRGILIAFRGVLRGTGEASL
jgi:hypothetical protein